jgi:hypothetical protein
MKEGFTMTLMIYIYDMNFFPIMPTQRSLGIIGTKVSNPVVVNNNQQ